MLFKVGTKWNRSHRLKEHATFTHPVLHHCIQNTNEIVRVVYRQFTIERFANRQAKKQGHSDGRNFPLLTLGRLLRAIHLALPKRAAIVSVDLVGLID